MRGTRPPNPIGRAASAGSLIHSIKRKLSANMDPLTGEGQLADRLSSAYLNALVEASTDRDPDSASARKMFLDAFLGLMNRVDPPRLKVEIDHVRRILICGPKLPKFTDKQLDGFVEKQQKALTIHASPPQTEPS